MNPPDRLASITAWICGIGFIALSLLVLDAVGTFKSAPVQRADLPPRCPAPRSGEQLHITVVYRDGLLDITCRTVHAALSLPRSPR